MKYTVINRFFDKENKNTLYSVGDDYPKGNYKPTKERIEELTDSHPQHKYAFIEMLENEKDKGAIEAKDTAEDEKNAIRTELEILGVSVHPNTGLEKLREKLAEAKAGNENKE